MPDPAARRLRSVLFTPGANERALQKAQELPADALIFDLEDAVAPAAKAQARTNVVAALAGRVGTRRRIVIRVNAIGTGWHEQDIAAVAGSGPSAVLIPKVQSAEDVAQIERALELADAPAALEIWAMIETPLAVLHADRIASAGQRLTTLVVGPNDLAKELRTRPAPDRAPLLASLSLCVLAARAHGATVLDGVFNDIGDLAGFEAECRQARALGFDGKTLIHPGQIESCNRIFSPDEAEIDYARRVVAAYEEAVANGRGVALLDGAMIEHLHVQSARALLAGVEA